MNKAELVEALAAKVDVTKAAAAKSIDALVEICNMERVQAIQCTYLVHYKQKCEVKRGSKSDLLPMRRALSARDLKATIH